MNRNERITLTDTPYNGSGKQKKHEVSFKYLLLLLVTSMLMINNLNWSQTIPIKMERNKTILPVRIGNSNEMKIILDSGMAFDGLLVYNPDLSDSIKLDNPIQVQIPGAGDGEPSKGIMDDSASFFVGDFEFKNQRVILLTSNTYRGFPTDGVIGYSILGHYTTEINYDNEKIILHNPIEFEVPDNWDSIPIYFKRNQIPWIDVSIAVENEETVMISTYIDFASGDMIELLEKDSMKFRLPEELTESYLGRGLSGDIYGRTGKITKLIIGSYELNDVDAAFTQGNTRSKQENADGIIGNNALRRFNLIFDYYNKFLHVKPNKYLN
ncbi:hypothetical protein ACFLSS_02995 [Bacteroidota bacterium]